jgi:hypothetical protein
VADLQWSNNTCFSGDSLTGSDENGSVRPDPSVLKSTRPWTISSADVPALASPPICIIEVVVVVSVSSCFTGAPFRELSFFVLPNCSCSAFCRLKVLVTCARARRRALASPCWTHSKAGGDVTLDFDGIVALLMLTGSPVKSRLRGAVK